MKPLGDFLMVRAVKVGLKTKQAVVDRVGLSRQTIFNVLDAKDDKDPLVAGARASTLDYVAVALQFREWSEAVEAWRDQDVMRGLVPDPIPLPRSRQGIINYMQLLGWDARRLAKESDVSFAALNAILRGTAPINEETREKIAKALGRGVAAQAEELLMEGEAPPAPVKVEGKGGKTKTG
jgi:lambda repressor-like predicted transcriptional regulator